MPKCPKCKVKMDTMNMMGVEFENCPRCTGVWLDRGELGALTRSRGGKALRVEVANQKRTQFVCPKCRPAAILFEGSHDLADDFQLDICGRCEGIWFDRGEFPSLLKNTHHP